jgi:4'-phosphopantetheinyl transferase
LDRGQVHLWSVPLGGGAADLSAQLSEDELVRARRFHFERDRDDYILARGALRVVLGQHLRRDPALIRFVYGPQGKPSLDDADEDLEFNLSHTRGLALVAVTRGRAIGVDVEQVRPFEEVAELPSRIFSRRELAQFERLSPSDQQTAFFSAWTRKESLVKATGLGFTMNVQEVEVTFSPGVAAQILQWPMGGAPRDWTLREVDVPTGYAAAVAVKGSLREVVSRRWPAA